MLPEGEFDYPATNEEIKNRTFKNAMVLVNSSIWIEALGREGWLDAELALENLLYQPGYDGKHHSS
jgi:hypothetical protein